MQKVVIVLLVLLVVLGVGYFIYKSVSEEDSKSDSTEETQVDQTADGTDDEVVEGEMSFTSPAFSNNQKLPEKYSCDGDGVNPELNVSNIPAGTLSLVLVLHDPDAPSGDFIHWMLWDIDPSISKIDEDSVPSGGFEGVNDFGKDEYGAPCPPGEEHRYVFTLYALDAKLELSSTPTREELFGIMEGMVLGEAKLTGLYGS